MGNNTKFVVWIGFLCIIMALGLWAAITTINKGLIVTGMNNQVAWGIWEAVYIFFTGLSAGSFFLSALGVFGVKTFKPVSRIAVLLAIILLMMAPVFLFVGLGRPWRFINLYLNFNPTSPISWGSWLLSFYPVVCIVYLYGLIKDNKKLATIFGILGVPTAIATHGYTGVLLGFIKARALWHTPLMPILFLTSAVVSGAALLIIVLVVFSKFTSLKIERDLIFKIGRFLLWFLVFDLFIFLCEVLTTLSGGIPHHYDSLMLLLTGRYAFLFLGVEILLGTMIPLLLLASLGRKISILIIASIMVIVGVFTMRFNVVVGGQIIQPYGGPLGTYIPTIVEWSFIIGVFALGVFLYSFGAKFLPLTVKTE